LLLGLRAPHRRSFPNCWDTVGGHLEAGETHEEALRRELDEEIGVYPTKFTVVGDYPAQAGSWLRLFKVEAWCGEPRIMNDEHVDLRWFTADEAVRLRALASPHYATIFRQLRLRAPEA
jgi:8-oxo-dGTP diphosphatase